MPNTPSLAPTRARRTAPPAIWRLGDGAPPAGPFVALAPGADVPLLALALPAALKGAARTDVARRQVQDRLGAAFDLRPLAGDGWTRAAIAGRSAVLRWRGGLGAAASRCQGIVPDYLALPAVAGVWTVACDRDGISARLGLGDGFTAEPALGAQMLAQALSDARASGTLPRAVLRIGTNGSVDALFDGVPLARDQAELPGGMVPLVLGHGEMAVDFARDPQADAAAIEARLRHALWPVLLVLIGVLGWAGAQALTIRHDRRAAVATEAETLAAVRRDLLPNGPILDLQRQVLREIDLRRAALVPLAAPADPLDLLRRAAGVLAAASRVQSVALGADGVTAEVLMADFRALDGLVTALAGSGITARVTRSAIDPGGVAATLLMEGAP